MMASAFKNPTYQHMVNSSSNNNNNTNSSSAKFYDTQSDLINRPIAEYKSSNRSRCTTDLMNRMSPEVRAQLFPGHSRHVRHINWSRILEDFLPRNPPSTDNAPAPNRQRYKQYKPVVLRNKTPFVQLNPDPAGLEINTRNTSNNNSNNNNTATRPSRAYTLPQNRDSDVLELLPTGDSSMNNFVEMRDIVAPFYHRMLSFDLRTFVRQAQDMQAIVLGSETAQQLNRMLNLLYNFFLSITRGLRQAVPRLQRVVLDTYSHFNTFDGYSLPLSSLHVVQSSASTSPSLSSSSPPPPPPSSSSSSSSSSLSSSSNAVFNDLPPRRRIEQTLSRSTIASYARYCCPEMNNNIVQQKHRKPARKLT